MARVTVALVADMKLAHMFISAVALSMRLGLRPFTLAQVESIAKRLIRYGSVDEDGRFRRIRGTW